MLQYRHHSNSGSNLSGKWYFSITLHLHLLTKKKKRHKSTIALKAEKIHKRSHNWMEKGCFEISFSPDTEQYCNNCKTLCDWARAQVFGQTGSSTGRGAGTAPRWHIPIETGVPQRWQLSYQYQETCPVGVGPGEVMKSL